MGILVYDIDVDYYFCKYFLLIRCGHLNIGDQIISVNGISLVGLPLSSCQTQIKVFSFVFLSRKIHVK